MEIKYEDYVDVLFYLESDPSEAIYDPDKPVTAPDAILDPDKSGKTVGTLTFEDLWSNKDDWTTPYPFAIDLPITDYLVPDESIRDLRKIRIGTSIPKNKFPTS